jgi:hypothetical protein
VPAALEAIERGEFDGALLASITVVIF